MSHSQQEPLLSPYTDDPEGNERSPDDATVEQVPVQGHLTRRRRHALVLGCLSIALITVIAVALSCSTRRSDSQPEDRDTGGEEYGIISNDPRLEVRAACLIEGTNILTDPQNSEIHGTLRRAILLRVGEG